MPKAIAGKRRCWSLAAYLSPCALGPSPVAALGIKRAIPVFRPTSAMPFLCDFGQMTFPL